MTPRSRQFELPIPSSWGGRRAGAGRLARPGRRSVPHRRRDAHEARCPAHVTLRRISGLPSLRESPAFDAVRDALEAASRPRFRLLQFSVQHDHVHLLVEADGAAAFVRGCQGLMIRLAKAINRALRRVGRVWGDRYHARALATPRAVRHCLVYILHNWKKHLPGAHGIDARSSAPWFSGWRTAVAAPRGPSPVVAARTWLARVGWLRHGRIGLEETQRPASRRR